MNNFLSLFSVENHQQAVTFLNSDEMETEVKQLYDKARAMGISGVPVIIIDGKWAIKGGHSSEVFVQVCFFHRHAMLPSLIMRPDLQKACYLQQQCEQWFRFVRGG